MTLSMCYIITMSVENRKIYYTHVINKQRIDRYGVKGPLWRYFSIIRYMFFFIQHNNKFNIFLFALEALYASDFHFGNFMWHTSAF